MLIAPRDVDHLKKIFSDARSGLLPLTLAPSVLFAFFTENPHLLMAKTFDEHEQYPITDEESSWLMQFASRGNIDFLEYSLPRLDFRTSVGRWSSLTGLPMPSDELVDFDLLGFNFLLGLRQVWSDYFAENVDDLAEDDLSAYLESVKDGLDELDSIDFSLDELIAELEAKLVCPRDQTVVLWAPQIWTPKAQAQQRVLLDQSLAPAFEKWKDSGLCLEDLTPSQFEDLVAEVLFNAGLKVYKVRDVPQGGRDLLARGILVPGEEPVEMAVEVKHRRVVDRPQVQMALYQNRAYPALLFVTSGRFTAG